MFETSPGPIQSTTDRSKQNTSGDKRKSKDENKPHTNKCIALINGCDESQIRETTPLQAFKQKHAHGNNYGKSCEFICGSTINLCNILKNLNLTLIP